MNGPVGHRLRGQSSQKGLCACVSVWGSCFYLGDVGGLSHICARGSIISHSIDYRSMLPVFLHLPVSTPVHLSGSRDTTATCWSKGQRVSFPLLKSLQVKPERPATERYLWQEFPAPGDTWLYVLVTGQSSHQQVLCVMRHCWADTTPGWSHHVTVGY